MKDVGGEPTGQWSKLPEIGGAASLGSEISPSLEVFQERSHMTQEFWWGNSWVGYNSSPQ